MNATRKFDAIYSHSKNNVYTVLAETETGYTVRTVQYTGWQGRPVVAETVFTDRNRAETHYVLLTTK